MMKTTNLFFCLFCCSLMLACSPETKQTEENTSTEPAKEAVQEAVPLREITIKALGNSMAEMSYDQQLVEIKGNSKVKITLINTATAEGMNHNIVIIKMGTGAEVAAAAVEAGADKGFIPDNPNIIAASQLTKPGETTVLEFDAPEKGSYHFICTYPGHYMKMTGRLIVD